MAFQLSDKRFGFSSVFVPNIEKKQGHCGISLLLTKQKIIFSLIRILKSFVFISSDGGPYNSYHLKFSLKLFLLLFTLRALEDYFR